MSRKRPHHGSRRRGDHSGVRRPHRIITGTLHVERPGHAAVETSEGTFRVAPRGLREGMNGDEVQVTLVRHQRRGGEPLAYVQGVLQRMTTSYIGTYGRADPLGVVVPLDVRIKRDFFVLPEDASADRLGVSEGDVVSARILQYPTRQSAGVVTIERRLGSASDLDLDVEAVIASYDLATDFPKAVTEEARGLLGRGITPEDLMGRVDLRETCCLTVDPTDARDFDDAVSATRLPDGGYELGVHIADVTHYVPWGSSVDVEARRRTCSVYLVDRVLPMLPEELSDDLCSLRPDEDRLCMSVRIVLDRYGRIVSADAAPSVICSKARLDYDTVDRLLQGVCGECDLPCADGWAHAVAETLTILDEVARLRTRLRRERGAIDFDTREAKVLVDEKGRPYDVNVRARTRATSLIEEAMLLANECVARMLSDHEVEAAYRVHERPAPDDMKGCVPVLRELGLVRADEVDSFVAGDPMVVQDVLERARGTSSEYLANALVLRAQRRAVYLPHNEGHYALGARAYCHFTSPIRRYPDDIVHRALKALLSNNLSSREQEDVRGHLPQLCRDCSERERVADAAGRASQRVKMAEYYADRVGESFSGVIVGVERYGLFVQLDDTCAEGLLSVRHLGEEWFVFDADRMTLTGESTGQVWGLGRRVAVEVVGTDPSRGRIDFALSHGSRPASGVPNRGNLES